jgi:heat shock protein HslJ
MMKILNNFILAVVLTAIIFSCGASPGEPKPGSSIGGTLVFAEVDGEEIDLSVYEEFSYSIDPGNHSFSSYDGCNTYSGNLEYIKGRYYTGFAKSTFLHCPGKRLYSPNHLRGLFRYTYENSKLRVMTDNSVHIYLDDDAASN